MSVSFTPFVLNSLIIPFIIKDLPHLLIPVITFIMSESKNGRIFDKYFSLGYTFSYKHHRKGYAYEALSLLTETLHNRYPAMEFICFTDPNNLPSKALLLKLGYKDLGYVEKITSNVFGKWICDDTLI